MKNDISSIKLGINGEDDLTFSNFLEKFNKKAAQKGDNFTINAQFFTHISHAIDELKKKHETPTNDFMDIVTWHKLMEIIPKDITLKTKEGKFVNSREFILETIGYINNADNLCIRNVSNEICAEIEFKLTDKNDIVFDNWYKVWSKVPLTLDRLNQIHEQLPEMTVEYSELLNEFNKRMKEVESAENTVESVSETAQSAVANLLKLSPKNKEDAAQAKKIVENLQPNLENLLQQKDALFHSFAGVRDVLRDYNMARKRWVEFLMSIRISYKSDRRASVNPKRMAEYFANFKKDLIHTTEIIERKLSCKK